MNYCAKAAIAAGLLTIGVTTMVDSAYAAPVVGGTTVIEVTNDRMFDFAPDGETTVDDSFFTLNISSGDIDEAMQTGSIVHADGGIRFTCDCGSGFGDTIVTLTNLVFDFTQQRVFGDRVSDTDGFISRGTGDYLFDFDLMTLDDVSDLNRLDDPILELTINGFFLNNGLDETFGRFATSPSFEDMDVDAVPLPGAAALMLTGLGGAAFAKRRKRLAA